VAHVCALPKQEVFCAGTIVGSCTHSHTTYSVCFHHGQYICFNPIYCPQEQWLVVQIFSSSGKLVKPTQVNDPNKPVSIYFNVCTAIAENSGHWGNCGGIAWERTCKLNNKYICPKDDSETSGCAYYEQLHCPYWGCERWATWLKGEVHTSHETAAPLEKGKQPRLHSWCLYPCIFHYFQPQ
jgi:hypothetical protein